MWTREDGFISQMNAFDANEIERADLVILPVIVKKQILPFLANITIPSWNPTDESETRIVIDIIQQVLSIGSLSLPPDHLRVSFLVLFYKHE